MPLAEVLSIQYKQFKQMKKRTGSILLVLGEKPKTKNQNPLVKGKMCWCAATEGGKTSRQRERIKHAEKTFTKVTLEP